MEVLSDDAIIYVLQCLDSQDRIAFACTCRRLRQICMDAKLLRKVDLSGCLTEGQKCTIKELLRDKQMANHIRELNLNNQHVINWSTDVNLRDFVIAFGPHLEALHVLNCGMTVKTLHHILQQAHKLTSLSFSIMDLTSEDVEFLLHDMRSSDGICLENIKNLHFEVLDSKQHLQILRYFVLFRCKYLQELEIFFWQLCDVHRRLEDKWNAISFPHPSTQVTDALQHLHSLVMIKVRDQPDCCSLIHFVPTQTELCDFICSVVGKKPRKTKWKKLWISPPIATDILYNMFHAVPFTQDRRHELRSVEAFTARGDLRSLLEKTDDNTVRNLQLHVDPLRLFSGANQMLEFWEPILRTGGKALKFLSVSPTPVAHLSDVTQHDLNGPFNTLFSVCSNIREIDLIECHLEKNICRALSNLKHLQKVQLMQCALVSKHNKKQLKEPNPDLLTFVENCQNIAEFHLYGCDHYRDKVACLYINYDLFALAKLAQLESLTLYSIRYIGQWGFLNAIFEQCKFLTTLRINVIGFDRKPFLPILESARSLKHLAIDVLQMDLGSEAVWRHLSQARRLERLCIKSYFKGSINILGAIKMIKSLPCLQVLHTHFYGVLNLHSFHEQITGTLEKDKSDRDLCFEFLWDDRESAQCWSSNNILPSTFTEMCCKSQSPAIPSF